MGAPARGLGVLALSCLASLSGCERRDRGGAVEAAEEDGRILVFHAYDGEIAGDYASLHWSNPNPYFTDYTGDGGDCANFASQSMLAGFAGSTADRAVFTARTRFRDDRYPSHDWWYSRGGGSGKATPEWAGANGLFTYLRGQAAHPEWAGIVADYVYSGSSPPAEAIAKGDVFSLSSEGEAYHTMIVVRAGASLSDVVVAYRSGICAGNSCPERQRTVQDYIDAHGEITWNLFHITGFAAP